MAIEAAVGEQSVLQEFRPGQACVVVLGTEPAALQVLPMAQGYAWPLTALHSTAASMLHRLSPSCPGKGAGPGRSEGFLPASTGCLPQAWYGL